MRTTLLQVDVFAEERLGGKPLAVFVSPPELSRERMQAWAREMNLSETIFIWPLGTRRYRARIFTPVEELPFAGHPSIGAAWCIQALGLGERDLAQETQAGLTHLWTDESGTVWLSPPAGELGEEVPVEAAAEALGVPTLWISKDRPPQVASAGLPHLLVHLDLDQVGGIRPPMGRMRDVLNRLGIGGLMVWSFTSSHRIHARGFAPGYGVDEDPATGSAAAALGVYLIKATGVTDAHRYQIAQGAEMGRPSLIQLALNVDGPGSIAVGGHVLAVFRTELEDM